MPTAIEIIKAHCNPVARASKKKETAMPEKPAYSKYKNKIVKIDGITFHSQGEAYYWLELKDRFSRGEFVDLKRQVPFEFYVNGVLVGKYIADYCTITHNGTIEVIDFKSIITAQIPLYQLKKSLMLACYGVAIKEVGKK